MEIWDTKGNVILDSVVTQNAEHVEEMMQSDYVGLQWVSNVKRVLPVGAYIIPFDDGVRYMLLDPYTPDQNNTDEFTYSPQFKHPKMYLGRVPYTRASKDAEGKDVNLLEWEYKGYLTTFLSDLCDFITRVFTDEGITTDKFSYSILGDIEGNISVSISNNDILSVLNNVCSTLDCEWHIDWEQRRLFLGVIKFDKNEGDTLVLTSGGNVGMTSVSSQKDTFYNVYLPQGSTRNMAAATTDGSYYATNRRLELDTDKYPDGCIYTDGKGKVITKSQFTETGLPKLVQTLVLDEIYPKIDLYAYDIRNRERYFLDDNGEKVIDHYDGDTPVYKRYAIWYMRLAYPVYNADGTIKSWKDATLGDTFKLIDGYTLMCSFGANTDSTLTSPLAGREFELNYVETDNEAKELSAKADTDKGDTGVTVKKGDFEIIYTTEGSLIIPTTEEQGLVPKGDNTPSKNGNKVIIFNVVMGEDFYKAAQNDLEVAAIREIKKQYADLNQYTFNSDNVSFKKDMPSLYIGRSVTYNDGVGNTLETRIMKLTTKIDFPFMVEITVGNKVLKGSTSQLKSDVQMILSGNKTIFNGITESVVRSLIKGFGGANFLSKVSNDTAKGIITFLQGTNWGNFTSETGAAMTVDPSTGQTYMEVDRLKVRLKAFFEQLEIQKVGFVGGKLIVTKGQGVDILDVENIYDSEGNVSAYRCYFLGEQEGRKIDNLLRVKDQMICKDFNVSEGTTDGATNKYYWRLATAVSSDVVKRGNNVCHWVDLSATDCDTGSDIPEIGDTICHLGNREDTDRQGAEILSVVDANSPSFTIYSGIDEYSLVGKEYIDMGVAGGKAYCNIYGSTYIGDRKRESGYLRWNDDKKTFEIKGTIDITSPLSSGGTIGGAIDDAANAYKGEFDAFTSNVNEVIGGFQAQIDGVIETWFYGPEPTLGNEPAVNWTDNATKDKHLGDLYYSGEGKAYRFQKDGDNYVWQPITDTDIAKALEEAKKANDAANAAQGTADSKMRVFVAQPTAEDEYSVGDMWVNATYPSDGSTYNNEILHCVTKKAAGAEFQIAHWAQSSNIKTQFNNFVNNTYTEDKADFYDQLDGKVETWYQTEDPKNKWSAADYSKHKGDIWYNDSENKSYRWTGTAWVELKDQAAIDAKTLAESKRRVFTTTALPTPPYDAKDLWVQGENGDIMVCVTPKAAGTTASASDWEKASKYTDDTAAKAAQAAADEANASITELGGTVSGIYNLTDKAFKDRVIDKTERDSLQKVLADLEQDWADVASSYSKLTENSLYDSIADDVKADFTSAYTKLKATYESFETAVENVINSEQVTDSLINGLYNNYENFKTDYAAYVSIMTVVTKQIDAILNKSVSDLVTELGGYKYLKKATAENNTLIEGGLILSTLIGLGYTDTDKLFHVMSGMSGIYDTQKTGNGIAFWAGGSMVDKQNDASENPAQFLVRHDGTGYAAGGNLWWEKNGKVHADPMSFVIGEDNLKNLLGLFQPIYSGGSEYKNITGIEPLFQFTKLRVEGGNIVNGELIGGLQIGDTAKFYIKDGVLFLDGDLAVTGGITMYASNGVTSGLLDQVYAILDSSKFEIKNGVITIKGEIGDGKVKGATLGGVAVTLNANGILEFDAYPTTLPASDVYAWAKAATKPTYSWGEITEKPSSFTPSAHTHDDRYYTESEIDTKLDLKLDSSLKGAADGLATLDSSGKVPSSQLPSYVDDVLEYDNKASFPTKGESGKIYIDKATNLTYRWGGTAYVEISQSLALGETSSTAYAGDKGKKNAEDIAALQTDKADKATTLSGYGITDAYTKTEVDTKLTDGSVTKIGTEDVGSATLPIYLKEGVPTAVGTSLAVDITGNSATATKLANARTLWGQSFDGSENVSGDMTGVGTITPTGEDLKVVGNLIVTGGIVMYADDGATIESGFAALLAAHIDGVTIKYNEAQQKIYSVMTGIKVNGATYKPSETDGYITIPDYPTSLDWENIENKPSTFTPASHTHTFASLTSKPTTISGYGITDAKIADGVITLGTATITPLTAHQKVTLASGTNNGTLKLTVGSTTTDNIAVKGLGSAAYTASTAYAKASHTHSQYLVASSLDGYVNALTENTSTNVFVTAIAKNGKTLSYTKSFTKKSLTAVSHSGWSSADTDKLIIPDMSFIAYWNGAYNSDGKSNLAYCNEGAFGDMATASKSSYYIKTEVDTKLTDGSVTKVGTTTVGATNIPIYLKAGVPTAVTLVDTANNLINNLTTGTSTPEDADYYISQYVGGGTTTTTFHRRPHSALYSYIKGKAEGTWAISVSGNAATASAVKDLTNSRTSYLNYGAAEVTSPSWLCAWNKRSDNTYEIRAISPANMLTVIKALPLAGGTMTAGARISHGNGNLYLGNADNNGWVMCQDICSQNASGDSYWSLRTDGRFHSRSAVVSGNTSVGSLTINGINVTKSSDGILKIDGNLIVTGGITMYATDGVASGLMEQILVDNKTIKKTDEGVLYAVNTGNVRSIIMGSTTYTPNDSGAVTLPEKVTWANIEGKPSSFTPSSHTHSSITIPVCSSLNGNSDVFSVEYAGGNNSVTTKPSGVDAFGVMRLRTAAGWYGQIMMSANAAPGMYYRNANGLSSSVGWVKLLDSGNFGDYAAAKSHTHSYLPLSGGTMTGAINLSNTNAKLAFGSLTTSPITGYKAPSLLSNGVGIYSRYGGSNDEGAIIITEDTCVIYNSADTGWNFQVMDKDLGTDLTNDATRSFGVNQNHQAWSLAGFVKSGSSDSYVLLGGGGHKALSDFSMAHTHPYLPLAGGTMTGGITFSKTSHLLWNSGSWYQRIFLTDDSTADTAVFTFQQSSNSGTSWSDLMTIRDNGKVIANTFVGALSGNASSATKLTSSAGSATLPIYFSDGKPVACTASSVFSNLSSSSATNLSVTVAGQNRTIANLYARYLGFTGRPSSMNVCYGDGTLRHFLATSTTTTGKPEDDAHILHFSWDNDGGWDGQLSIPTTTTKHVQWRTISGKDSNGNYIYNAWKTLANLTDNVASASKWATARKITLTGSVTGSVSIDGSGDVTLATTTNHTHAYLPLAGGTMTGQIQRAGQGSSWIKGRDNAMIRVNSKNGYSVLSSIKTTNGSWEIGHYDASGYYNNLLFGYYTDTAYSANDNNEQAKITFTSGGQVTATQFNGALNGNASSATTASKLGTATVGGGTQHFYLNAGTATASTATVGGTAKPMYLKSGVMTAIAVTVGSASKPVYLNGGTITACSSSLTDYLPLTGGQVTGDFYVQRTSDAASIWARYYNKTAIRMVASTAATFIQCANYAWNSNVPMYLSGPSGNDGSTLYLKFSSVVASGGITMYSDVRKKNILSDELLSVKGIADAPLFAFNYKSDKERRMHTGTSAQYWYGAYGDMFGYKDDEGFYTLEYQNLGVAMGISLAREIVKYESKTDKKIRLMKKKINELEARVKELEERRTA